jgi:hypothetical protein
MTAHLFWTTLDSLPGLTAAKAEWQRLLGDGFDHVSQFLRPTGEIAQSLPRPNDSSYRIVCHGSDDYVGVCPDGGPTVALTRDELLLFELHQGKLGAAVAAALKLDQRCEPISGIPNAWALGRANQPGQMRLPVFMAFRIEDDEYREIVLELRGRHPEGFIFFSPTGRTQVAAPGTGISLAALLGIDSTGAFLPTWTGDSWLSRSFVPHPTAPSRTWPNPEEHTTAKVWTLKNGTLRMSTKTEKKSDGTVEFAPTDSGELTFQMRFMQLMFFKHPASVSLAEVIQQVYPDDSTKATVDAVALAKTLRKVRSLVSDIRTKKFAKAGLNPDILPSLSIEVSKDTGISLRLAHIHRMDDKDLDDADEVPSHLRRQQDS